MKTTRAQVPFRKLQQESRLSAQLARQLILVARRSSPKPPSPALPKHPAAILLPFSQPESTVNMTTMKAVLAKEFGAAADVLSLSDSHPRPPLVPGSGKLLVRVHACSMSPGDWRTLSGGADLVREYPGVGP